MKFYYGTNTFDLHIFDNETMALFKDFFKICTEMRFVSLFFLNERNITTSLFMIHLKCTAVYYANLNSSSINKPFLNYGSFNMLLHFFFISYLCFFKQGFVKNFMKELSFFNKNFQKSFQDVVYYKINTKMAFSA